MAGVNDYRTVPFSKIDRLKLSYSKNRKYLITGEDNKQYPALILHIAGKYNFFANKSLSTMALFNVRHEAQLCSGRLYVIV